MKTNFSTVELTTFITHKQIDSLAKNNTTSFRLLWQIRLN